MMSPRLKIQPLRKRFYNNMITQPIPETPPQVSINRVHIVDLPGLPIDAVVKGKLGRQLLSSFVVMQYAWEQANALQLPTEYRTNNLKTRLELPPYVSACVSHADSTVRQMAQQIGQRLGRNLGHILVALKQAHSVNQAVRTDWRQADWESWRTIKQVWLTGGLLQGDLGTIIIKQAQQYINHTDYANNLSLNLTPYRSYPTLLGAARYLPIKTGQTFCFDFGHTQVKRAKVNIVEGALVKFAPYPPITVPWDIHTQAIPLTPELGEQVLHFVSQTITETIVNYHTENTPLNHNLMLCIAAYVKGGHLLGNGLYATLSHLTDDVRLLLAKTLGKQLNQSFNIDLIHDGTAISALHAGESSSVVLALGTALGVGFPPSSSEGLRSMTSLESNH